MKAEKTFLYSCCKTTSKEEVVEVLANDEKIEITIEGGYKIIFTRQNEQWTDEKGTVLKQITLGL